MIENTYEILKLIKELIALMEIAHRAVKKIITYCNKIILYVRVID